MQKLKILIADDEPKIIQLIIKLIEWDKLDVELLDTVSTGYDAYEYAKNLRPDIIISDIRMPGYDGIEVLQKLYDDNIHIPTLIISGYKQFDYAIKALKYGAQDFLIKPINGKELNTALSKICSSSRLNSKQASITIPNTAAPEKNYEWFRSQLMLDCFNQNMISNDVSKINQVYGTKFQSGLHQVLAIRIDTDDPIHFPIDSDDFNEKFNVDKFFVAKIHDIFNSLTSHTLFHESESILVSNVFYGILNYAEEDQAQCAHLLIDMHRELIREFSKYANIIPIMAISKSYHSLEKLPSCFSQVLTLLNSKALLDYTKCLDYATIQYTHNVPSLIPSTLLKELDHCITTRNTENILMIVDDILHNNESLLLECPLYTSEYIFQLINLIRFSTNKMDIKFSDMEYTQLQSIYYSRSNYQQIHLFTQEIFQYFIQILSKNISKESAPVQLVKKYITRNYAEKISLETLADVTGLSSAYLSSIFKSETGATITDFITSCRIEKAKELLLNTTMNVSEIANNVGYIDARYFSKIFIKSTGLRPMQYRKYNLT